MKTYKKKILPLFASILLFSMVIVGICGMYVATVFITGIDQELEKFDTHVDKMASLISEEQNNCFHLLNIYADFVQQRGEGSKDDSLAALTEFLRYSAFTDIGIVDEGGKGTFGNGMSIHLPKDKMNVTFVAAERELQLNSQLDDNSVIFGVPYYKEDQCAGMIIGIKPLKAIFAGIEDAAIKTRVQAAYLVDDTKQAVLAYPGSAQGLDEQLKTAHIYDKAAHSGQNLLLGKKDNYSDSSSDFIKDSEKLYEITLEGGTIWYQHRVPSQYGFDYTLLVSGKVGISDEMELLLQQTIRAGSALMGIFLVVIMMMVISNRLAQHRLGTLAYIDQVTEGENWNKFKVDAKKILRRKRNREYALITFDIDHFRVINDIHGHNKGNIILKETQEIIKKQLYRKEKAARYSGDVFAALVIYEDDFGIQARLCKWQKALEDGLDISDLHFSFGVYRIKDYGLSFDRMSIYASLARETVKHEIEKKVGFFDEKLREKVLKEQEIESRMQTALENKEFKVYVQPKYEPNHNALGGAEALVRWLTPENKLISPGVFIPIFEKNAFITKLDDYMLEEVCRLQHDWLAAGKKLVTVSVNISRIHLLDEDLVPMIVRTVDRYGLPHSCIEIELTESAFFDNKKTLIQTVDLLKQNGFAVSMDDFGSGYSSLNTLKDLSFDVVKLDGEFFKKMSDQERSRIIIKDTIAMVKQLNIQIVAEGIEEKEQVDFLKEIGCDLIQGFYFAKPMPAEEFEKLLISA